MFDNKRSLFNFHGMVMEYIDDSRDSVRLSGMKRKADWSSKIGHGISPLKEDGCKL